jgi:hypothetical protein
MKATPGRKNTVLLGKCIYEANKDNPDIRNMIAIRTCPPGAEALVKALRRAGIEINPEILKFRGRTAASNMKPYENRPEFDESLFKIE